MGNNRKSPNPNNIDPTEYPLEKVPQIVEDDDSDQYPEGSPIEEGVVEEQQGDLEGLDGQNSLDRPEDKRVVDEDGEVQDLESESEESLNRDTRLNE